MDNTFLKKAKKEFENKNYKFIEISSLSKNIKRKGRIIFDVICPKKHLTTKHLESLRANRQCKKCIGFEKGIEQLHEAAKSKADNHHGGKCLSKIFYPKKPNYRYKFKCNLHGIFYQKAITIFHAPGKQAHRWCPDCGYDNSRSYARSISHKYADYVSLAKERGGKFLEDKDKVKNKLAARHYYNWCCALGHEFRSTYNKIQQGRWCWPCGDGKSERICRAFFEQLFNKKFKKVMPKWLTNDYGSRLEFDGLNKDLSLAFEFQGPQHREIKREWQTKEDFKLLQHNDKCKIKICKKKKIKLILIHDYEKIFKDNYNLKPFIKLLKSKKVKIPTKVPNKINLSGVMSPNIKKEVDEFAKLYNGKVVNYPADNQSYIELTCGNPKHLNIKNEWNVVKRRKAVCATCSRTQREKNAIKIFNEQLKEYLLLNNHELITPYTGHFNYFKIKCPNGTYRDLKIQNLRKWYKVYKYCFNCKSKITKLLDRARQNLKY